MSSPRHARSSVYLQMPDFIATGWVILGWTDKFEVAVEHLSFFHDRSEGIAPSVARASHPSDVHIIRALGRT